MKTDSRGAEHPHPPQAGQPPARAAAPQYVSHGDLLRIAQRRGCFGIETQPIFRLCRPEKNFWVFKAVVYKSQKCRGFVGYGDAHPGNVSPLIFNNAEMRMAETRAVNRALRKAYGVGLCSLEELPPWTLRPDQAVRLRRNLQMRSIFSKGGKDAKPSTRPKPSRRKSATRRRALSSASSQVRVAEARG
jgi:hypothetical protein